jgi:voltage-gated potassium channel
MYNHVKKHVHILLHPSQGNSKWDKIINIFLITLILANLAATIIETDPVIYHRYGKFFHAFDAISVTIFCVEYILRVWSVTHETKYKHWLWGRLKYMVSWEAMIDLAAILPFFLYSYTVIDLRSLRLLRLLRLLRIFRLTNYTKSTRIIANVFKSRFNELLLSFVLTVSLIIIAACLMYFAEHHAVHKGDEFSTIPKTLWWSVVTLTTTGYGDMIPVTTIGRLLTGLIMLISVGFFALPAGIITAGFLEESRKYRQHRTMHCPHCGELIDLHEHEPKH